MGVLLGRGGYIGFGWVYWDGGLFENSGVTSRGSKIGRGIKSLVSGIECC